MTYNQNKLNQTNCRSKTTTTIRISVVLDIFRDAPLRKGIKLIREKISAAKHEIPNENKT
jgi:hypothetical protein